MTEATLLILTERTPNPDAMKFTPHVSLTAGASFSFSRDSFEEGSSALAACMFALPDVMRVYVAAEFLTVTRAPAGQDWAMLRPAAVGAIAEHIASGQPAVADDRQVGVALSASAIEVEIRDVLGRHVQPGVARDGGEILFDRFEPEIGVLWIRMQGACGGCPSARLTLKAGVEAIVRRYVPEVMRVEEAAGGAVVQVAPGRFKSWLAALGERPGRPTRTRFTHAGEDMPDRPDTSATPAAPSLVRAPDQAGERSRRRS